MELRSSPESTPDAMRQSKRQVGHYCCTALKVHRVRAREMVEEEEEEDGVLEEAEEEESARSEGSNETVWVCVPVNVG